MATSRQQGGCRINFSNDDDHNDSDAAIIQQTATGDVYSTPPRRIAHFGLLTPLASPDSQLQLRSFDFRCTLAPHAPPPLHDIPKDTKPFTFAPKPSKYSNKESTTITTLPPLTGLLTPDSPPRNLRRIRSEVKSESSPSPDTASNVAELLGSPCHKQSTNLLQNELAVNIEPEDVLRAGRREQQCDGITNEKKCRISVYHPDRYCIFHVDQDTGSKSFEESSEGSSITSPHPAGLPTPDSTPPLDSRLICWETEVKSESGPSPEAISSVVEIAETSSQTADLLHNTLTVITKVKIPAQSQPNGPTITLPLVSIYQQEISPKTSRAHRDGNYNAVAKSRRKNDNAEFWSISQSVIVDTMKMTKVKSESSPSPETRSNVAEIAETSWKASKLPRNKLTLIIEDTGSSVSTSSANGKGPQCQSTGTAEDSTTEPNVQCCENRCKQAAKLPARYCEKHIPASYEIPFTPFISTTPSDWASIPGQLTNYSSNSASVVRQINEEGCTVHRRGGYKSVRFRDYIPQYLQADTQQKLRDAISKKDLNVKDIMPGYVYALKVTDPEHEGKLAFKVGYSGNVRNRYNEWKDDCSYITGFRGWWPGSIDPLADHDESLIEELIASNQQGNAGPMAGQLERLVHIELADLATYAPYLHPGFPDITYRDVLPQSMAERKPCMGCKRKRKEHREIFTFRRVEEGDLFGKEWDKIVAPVIEKWGQFLKTYFAEKI
ncbi:hypothetical protein AZE42_10076 [Rhizopogon vesiculosus]|uniref:Bacteriophage T5 Orf172 DNA-binding domain-containing protein n=1 Tax=Rhizopogon vesiculosus TaxID=180088 RepID=A0A1J8QLY8_9AGAM|nr:hypothetical protein AZE42_10076 [Rhizopogon vesiculosus]